MLCSSPICWLSDIFSPPWMPLQLDALSPFLGEANTAHVMPARIRLVGSFASAVPSRATTRAAWRSPCLGVVPGFVLVNSGWPSQHSLV